MSSPLLKASRGKGGTGIYIKGVTVRFGLDDRITLQILRIVTDKATGTPHGMYYICPH